MKSLLFSFDILEIDYKRLNFIIIILVICLTYFSIIRFHSLLPQHTNIHTANNANNKETQKYYFGVDVDMSQIVPGSKNYVVNSKGEDLIDIAASLNINIFRIMNHGYDSKYTYSNTQWNLVLNKMAKKGIKAIILNESPNSIYPNTTSSSTTYEIFNHLYNYILGPNACNNPDVYAIDISNEPVLNSENLNIFYNEAQVIKSVCPNVKVTIGGWKVDNNKKDPSGRESYSWNNPKDSYLLKNIVDFYAPHFYGYDIKSSYDFKDAYTLTVNYVKILKQKGGNKPILIDEFGAGNGQALTDQNTLGSKELQSRVYLGVLQAAIDQHLLGATSYLFYPRNSHPEGWNIIGDHGNSIFPAAEAFRIINTNASPIFNYNYISNDPTPNNFLLTDNDNNHTISVRVGDIIGIHISGDKNKKYILQTDTSYVEQTEKLSSSWTSGKYDAVFQILRKGIDKITIYENGIIFYSVSFVIN